MHAGAQECKAAFVCWLVFHLRTGLMDLWIVGATIIQESIDPTIQLSNDRMPILKPTFSIVIGSLNASTDNPVAGPRRIIIERDMDIPADAMQLHLMERGGVSLDDEVAVALGHDGENESVFTGNVVALEPAITGVKITALGRMNALLNLRTSTWFENQTAGSIVKDLIDQAGLSAGKVDDGPRLPRFAVDNRLSAFAQLKELAERLGYELYADHEGNVKFHALGAAANLDAAGLLGAAGAVTALLGAGGGEGYAFGKHLLEASAQRQNAAWSTVEVGGESPMSGQGDTTAHWLTINDADYRGSDGDGDPKLLVRDPVARYKDLADRFAAGRLATAARVAHQVCVTVLGRPTVDLGDDISTTEVPEELLNGSGYVRAIRHRFGDEMGFVTDLRISLAVES